MQLRATAAPEGDPAALAASGTAGSRESLPHLAAIQRSFGTHDVGGIVAHTDRAAAGAAMAMGATAFATGNHVAFAGAPDLHTAAHEAAHVVQQRQGVHLYGGVGEVGDGYERHADAVADRVVAGKSAQDLLDRSPAASGVHLKASTTSPTIEIHPKDLTFAATDLGESSHRQIAIVNHSDTHQTIRHIFGMSTKSSAPPPPAVYEKNTPRPIPLSPTLVGHNRVFSGAFEVADQLRNHVIPPRGSVEVWVDFVPTKGGSQTGTFWVVGADGTTLGTFGVSGNGIAPPAQIDEKGGLDLDLTPTATGDKAVDNAKMSGLSNLLKWQNASTKAIVDVHNKLVSEWSDYIHKTASNPTLPASAPDGSFLGKYMENGIQGLAGGQAEKLVERAMKHLAKKAAGGVAGATIGSAAGPPGAAIGFAVGILVETLVGELAEWLGGEDPAIMKALREQYESGFSDGSHKAGEIFEKKLKELEGKQNRSLAHQRKQIGEYQRLINGSKDAGRLDQLIAEVKAHTEMAQDIKPLSGFSDQLLQLWVREHAAGPDSAGKDVNAKQWQKAAKEVTDKNLHDPETIDRTLFKQPDLFVTQCFHEWEIRGLALPQELRAELARELATLGVAQDTRSHHDEAGRLDKLAQGVQKRFNQREFRWTNIYAFESNGWLEIMSRVFKRGEIQPRVAKYDQEQDRRYRNKDGSVSTLPGPRVDMADQILCYPKLVVGKDTCYVERFYYRVSAYGNERSFVTTPGQQKLDYVQEAPSGSGPQKQLAASGSLHAYMDELGNHGVAIQAQGDAADAPQLQRLFGADLAAPRTQNSDGRSESIDVYKTVESWAEIVDILPEDVLGKIYRMNMTQVAGVRMVRAGNTVLIIER